MISTMEKLNVSLKAEKRGELTIDNFINSTPTEITSTDKIRLAVLKIRNNVIAIK